MSIKILLEGKKIGTVEADLLQTMKENDQKKNAGVLLDYNGETKFDFEFQTDGFEKAMHDFKMSKEIKIWRGSEILCAFDRKDIAAIKEIPEGSRVELQNGDWFNSGHSVEKMKEILRLTPDKQLEILQKNIMVLSLTHGSLLRETQFTQGVRHAIDEILKHTGMTIDTLLEEQREKEKKQND